MNGSEKGARHNRLPPRDRGQPHRQQPPATSSVTNDCTSRRGAVWPETCACRPAASQRASHPPPLPPEPTLVPTSKIRRRASHRLTGCPTTRGCTTTGFKSHCSRPNRPSSAPSTTSGSSTSTSPQKARRPPACACRPSWSSQTVRAKPPLEPRAENCGQQTRLAANPTAAALDDRPVEPPHPPVVLAAENRSQHRHRPTTAGKATSGVRVPTPP